MTGAIDYNIYVNVSIVAEVATGTYWPHTAANVTYEDVGFMSLITLYIRVL